MNQALIPHNMTGSAFLRLTRNLAVGEHYGDVLSPYQQSQIMEAVKIYGPEFFYQDGELFNEHGELFNENEMRREAELLAWEQGGRDAYHAWDEGR